MVFRENIGDFTDMHNEKKIDLEVTFKRHHFGYWDSCKRLPNFVNVAALDAGQCEYYEVIVKVIKQGLSGFTVN